MASKPKKRRTSYRVFADDEGEVFLARKPDGPVIAVKRPVTADTLNEAKARAIDAWMEGEDAEAAKKLKAIGPTRAEAQKEIEAALDPIRKGRWLHRLDHTASYFLIRALTVFFTLVLIALAYKGVQLSSERLPEPLHILVLCIYVFALGFLLRLIGTEDNREKYRRQIIAWLGPRGMLVLPCLLLVTAGAVMASITFRLYNRGLITLDTCSGRPVTEAGLLDFYMWHFVNIVPTLQLTKLWRWGEPYCYTQSRVGLLIFAFQLLVVIPSFNTIRFYWKHRKTPAEFIYDPYWTPETEIAGRERAK